MHALLRFSNQAIYIRMPPHKVHWHITAYKVSDGHQFSHIATFEPEAIHHNFVQYIEKKGPKEGDWYHLDEHEFHKASKVAKVHDHKGLIFNLNDV